MPETKREYESVVAALVDFFDIKSNKVQALKGLTAEDLAYFRNELAKVGIVVKK